MKCFEIEGSLTPKGAVKGLTVNMKCFEIYFYCLYIAKELINRKHEMF